MKEKRAYQIRIALKHTSPSVVRTMAIPQDATLHQLHECIQILFGWYDIHPYIFRNDQTTEQYVKYVEDWDELDSDEDVYLSSDECCLSDCFEVGSTWFYVYDFGDWWEHQITIEKELELEPAGRAKLISWEGENLCEDSGGIESFYEKLEILNDPKHEEYENVKKWFDMHRHEFHANQVQMELMNIEKDFFMERQQSKIADICNEIFSLTAKDTLFHVKTETKTDLYLWFSDHDETKNVYFFRSEKDFLHGYFSNFEHEAIYPLYFNGYCLNYPEITEIAEMDLPSEMLMPQLRKYEAGIGEVEISKEENDEIKDIVICISDLMEDFAEVYDILPDISEQKKVYVRIEPTVLSYRLSDFNAKLEMAPKRLNKRHKQLLKDKKHTKEQLHMNLLSVADIINIGNISHYYIAASGSSTSFLNALKQRELRKTMTEISERFISYMISCGIPKAVYVSDFHLYKLLTAICDELKIDLHYQQYNHEIIMEQYEEAMVEQNPLEQFDQELLDKIMDMSDEEMMRFIEEQPDEKMKRLLKQILFMNIFIKE